MGSGGEIPEKEVAAGANARPVANRAAHRVVQGDEAGGGADDEAVTELEPRLTSGS